MILESGQPDNDLLLYFPAHDVLGTEGRELLKHFDGHGPEVDSSAFGRLAQQLMNDGFTMDFISDKQIADLNYKQGIYAGEVNYQAVVVPTTEFMPISTIQKLHQLADRGNTIIFHGSPPASVPGWKDYEEREKELEDIISQMEVLPNVLIAQDIHPRLFQAGIHAEAMASMGLDFIRRESGEAIYYFISNWSGEDMDDWIELNQNSKHVILMDPMHEHIGKAESTMSNGKISVRLQLAHGASLIIKCTDIDDSLNSWPYIEEKSESMVMNGPWTVDFVNGGPELPVSRTIDKPDFWTSWESDKYVYYSGLANYTTTFDLNRTTQDYLLDLGEVYETARVFLNEQEVGTLVGPKFRIRIPNSILQTSNTLRIEVANKMANRIIKMDRDRVFWKKFYNTNFPPRRRENLGRMGLFDASQWDILPSGMAGPVTLTTLQKQ